MGDGEPVATLSLATTEAWKDRDGTKKEKTEWHRVSPLARAANTKKAS